MIIKWILEEIGIALQYVGLVLGIVPELLYEIGKTIVQQINKRENEEY